MKRALLAVAVLCALAFVPAMRAQNCAPMSGIGDVQFFDNTGNTLSAGALYAFNAGTSTQAPSYTDSTCSVLNANPLPLSSSGRASVWLTSQLYKLVLCFQNDGATCASGDVLWSQDNVPGVPMSTSSGSSFTGIFISGTSSPATTGILRLASAGATLPTAQTCA
jgi:hypothetical protein